jgi:hypothetical protein
MVLPVRIELTTSALPRMRSTTELRQHKRQQGTPGRIRRRAYGLERPACQGMARLVLLSEPSISERLAAVAPPVMEGAMSQPKPDRAERLAAALRENLRRRKQQARGDSAGEAQVAYTTPGDDVDSPPRPD